VDLPVTPPVATNARALPTAELVGPVDVAAVDAIAGTPCAELDPAALLAAGRYAWRVLIVGPEGPYALGDDDTSRKAQYARLKQWAAADAKLVARCGGSGRTSVLVAAHGASPWGESSAMLLPNADTVDAWLLVADPTPDARPRFPTAPPAQTGRPYLVLAGGGRSWAVLGSDPSIPATEHPTATEAAARIATLDTTGLVFTGNPARSWADAVAGLDALAGIGVVPTIGLGIGGDPPLRARTPMGTTRLTLGDAVPVLAFAFPSYSTSPLYQMIGSGTVTDTPDIPDPDAALQRAKDAPPAKPTPKEPATEEPGALPPFPYRREP
jgi:hypothetical protein